MSHISTTEKALKMLRNLPRVSLANIRDNPGSRQGVSFENIFLLQIIH